ncbi:hypothetical protein SARC_03002 [Sphaeroforma arctica JP610]|uniref:GCS light chain n=1 Tax=Sphaeroforma arctica JP610 TaxID=667725 RepID=A0A0L0G795_9EUKA|nr:hypothetical protein SARC_03002 [Sphaeroforma arctica JP610]KNC84794.1 hypothetical protein SARC_03002 [Sphaeroforma arctica JP610]|eukprot:XP_014158696.1 hypothetical protein SARC_03002 [Sphaeroforma arctica JP610]
MSEIEGSSCLIHTGNMLKMLPGSVITDNNNSLFVSRLDQSTPSSDLNQVIKAVNELRVEGKIDQLGVSDFNKEEITQMIEETEVYPDQAQVDVSEKSMNCECVQFGKDNNIEFIAHADPPGSV